MAAKADLQQESLQTEGMTNDNQHIRPFGMQMDCFSSALSGDGGGSDICWCRNGEGKTPTGAGTNR